MRVRMRVAVSGTRNGKAWPPIGAVMDVPDEEGAELCAGGLALPVPSFEVTEEAVRSNVPEEQRTGAITEENSAALVRSRRVSGMRPGR